MNIKRIGLCFAMAFSFAISTKAEGPVAPPAFYNDESTFISGFSGYGFKTPDQLTYNRTASVSGFRDAYGFNIPSENNPIGFKWNPGDEQTNEWRPQGITGFTWNSKRYLLVTWYALDTQQMEHKGSRVSLINITDMNNITYRHILLVQNIENRTNSILFNQSSNPYTQLGMFIPVTCHAGGAAYYAGKLFVAQTGLGFRVFELNKIIAVENNLREDSIGKMSNGKLKAFNYGYILPQVGYYYYPSAAPFSCVETGTGLNYYEKFLWTGQYIPDNSSRIPTVYGFPIDSKGMLSPPTKSLVPKDKDEPYVYRMQGVYRDGNKTYMTITGAGTYEGSTARLVTYVDGAAAATRFRWPHGAEDLYYEIYRDPSTAQITKYLWCLTEYETEMYGRDNRVVFAVRIIDY